MFCEVDQRLAALSARLWSPIALTIDFGVRPPQISAENFIVQFSAPPAGPETLAERFQTINWRCRRRSRWFISSDFSTLVEITATGRLIGEIGFDCTAANVNGKVEL